jgi:hypothetical protein
MNARDLVSELRTIGEQDQNVIFAFVADHLYELRLNSGGRINDLMDFKLLLHELSEAWRFAEFPEGTRFPEETKVHQMRSKVTRMPQQRWEGHCPDCGHVHIDGNECGFPTGGGRYCRCERTVVA